MASGQVVGEVSLDCRLREVAMLLSDDIQLERVSSFLSASDR